MQAEAERGHGYAMASQLCTYVYVYFMYSVDHRHNMNSWIKLLHNRLELLEKVYANDTTFPIIWHSFLQTEKKNIEKKKGKRKKEKKRTVSSCHYCYTCF